MIDLIVPRRLEERKERYKKITYKRILDYMKGSRGSKYDFDNLYLDNSPITELPKNLEVYGYLSIEGTLISEIPEGLKIHGIFWVNNTPLSKKYTEDQIRKMIIDRGGYIKDARYYSNGIIKTASDPGFVIQ